MCLPFQSDGRKVSEMHTPSFLGDFSSSLITLLTVLTLGEKAGALRLVTPNPSAAFHSQVAIIPASNREFQLRNTNILGMQRVLPPNIRLFSIFKDSGTFF